jgi:hypothetical protein
MIRVCAWCKEYQGEKEPLEDLDVTHDMCPACLEAMRRKIDAGQAALKEKYQNPIPGVHPDGGVVALDLVANSPFELATS